MPCNELTITTRFTSFLGTREEVLERLPSVCPRERLELGTDRISLVADEKRVDVLIRAEMNYRSGASINAVLLAEFAFTGKSEHEVDIFMHRFHYGYRLSLH